ncbi:hypothetical protein X975_02703, partial [Stegodyphus mimosarum]
FHLCLKSICFIIRTTLIFVEYHKEIFEMACDNLSAVLSNGELILENRPMPEPS